MENSPVTRVLGRKHPSFAACFMEEGKQNSQVHVRQTAVTWLRLITSKKKNHMISSLLQVFEVEGIIS